MDINTIIGVILLMEIGYFFLLPQEVKDFVHWYIYESKSVGPGPG